jgi:hypothetical protein
MKMKISVEIFTLLMKGFHQNDTIWLPLRLPDPCQEVIQTPQARCTLTLI